MEKLAQQQDYHYVPDIITMMKELGFDYDKDVSLHHNPLTDQRVLGASRTAFNKVDEADREMEGPQIADLEKMAMTGNVERGSSAANIFNREHKKRTRIFKALQW